MPLVSMATVLRRALGLLLCVPLVTLALLGAYLAGATFLSDADLILVLNALLSLFAVFGVGRHVYSQCRNTAMPARARAALRAHIACTALGAVLLWAQVVMVKVDSRSEHADTFLGALAQAVLHDAAFGLSVANCAVQLATTIVLSAAALIEHL